MATRRQHRVNQLILETLSLVVPGRVSDPRLVDVQITRVETTQDLATAKVYYTCDAEDDGGAADALTALKHGEGFLRAELADLGLRRLPHLVFTRDRQFESGARVLALLQQLKADGALGSPDDADSDAESPVGAASDADTSDSALSDADALDDTASDADAPLDTAPGY